MANEGHSCSRNHSLICSHTQGALHTLDAAHLRNHLWRDPQDAAHTSNAWSQAIANSECGVR